MGLPLGWNKKPKTDRQKIEANLQRAEGSIGVTNDQLWQYIEAGRFAYAQKVDPAGATCSIADLVIALMKPEGTELNGQPWITNIQGERCYSYFTPTLGPCIYLAEPSGLRHEMLHYLDWLLHRDVMVASDGQLVPRCRIIGHGVEGDPFREP